MRALTLRSDVGSNVRSGLSLCVPSTGQKKAKSREPRTAFVQSSALSTVTGVGAQVAPQRCPILRTRVAIVPRLATLKNCQRRSRDILFLVQRTFWNPDSRTFYFLVDNSSVDEAGPVLVYAEPGPPTLFFSSARVGGPGGINLYLSRMDGGWSFGPAELVPGVNSDADDMQPYVRRDGQELVFASNRAGGQGSFDIWSASRDSIAAPWTTLVNLGLNVNSAASESRPLSPGMEGCCCLAPHDQASRSLGYLTRCN